MSETVANDKYIGKLLEDRYQILELIGQGGMSVVYRALDTRLSRNVAVKVMRDEYAENEEFRANFAAESHAVAMLSHPNIVAVYDVSHNNDVEFIVLELINGITMRQYMNRKGPLDWKEVLHFSKQIADALRHAHQHGIIHRDIKPQNIMLLKDGSIKVADFGIAALENNGDAEAQGIGSINYLAPETLRGEYSDFRLDIYSLGVMMYEMICGHKPYEGKSPAEVLLKITGGETPKVSDQIPEVPEEFSEIISKAMAPVAEDRYGSADELLDDFNNFTIDYLKAEGKYNPDKPAEIAIREKNAETKKHSAEIIKRSGRVGFTLSSFGLLLLSVLLFGVLWKGWLAEIFSVAERVNLPDFTGYNYDQLTSNTELTKVFDFKINYIVDTTTAGGTVLSQEPVAGRSLMKNKKGIPVTLNVSTGYILTEVPDVTGLNYKEASLKLTNAGFQVEINNVASEIVDKDLVISSSPIAGEQISAGSTVYIDVSGGVEIAYIKMPNLIGLSEESAINKISVYNLTYAGTERVDSEFDAGTVIAQSTPAFAELEERTNIIITVSNGPKQEELPPPPEILIP